LAVAHDLAGATLAFDLDGCLVDTAPDLIGTLNTILAEHGHQGLPLASARSVIGHGARAMLSRGQTLADTIEEDRATDLVLRAGEVSFHHTLSFHRSGINRTAERRIGIGVSYIPTHVRHVGATRLVEGGADASALQCMYGWSLQMAEKYTKTATRRQSALKYAHLLHRAA